MIKEISSSVDEALVNLYAPMIRPYLGLSGMGDSCLRKIYYSWRFACPEIFSARLYRLFRRGQREEEVVIDDLRAAGYQCTPYNPDTGKQFEVVLFDGHVKGHSDGFIKINGEQCVLEIKTANNKSWTKIQRAKNLKISHYKYFCQTQCYMYEFNTTKALQVVVNKDNDANYYELLERDDNIYAEVTERLVELMTIPTAPKRLSEDSTYWECSYCYYKDICHNNKLPRKTCRLCSHVELASEGRWLCTKDNDYKSLTAQLNGCKQFKRIK